MTHTELLERHCEREQILRRDIKNIETLPISSVQCQQITYGQHTVDLIYADSFPQQFLDQIAMQYRLAETMGILPTRDTELHLVQCKSDTQLGGCVSAMPTDTVAEPLLATLMLNTVASADGGAYTQRIPYTQDQLKEIIKHEMWHAIDLAGNHSRSLNGSLDAEPIYDEAADHATLTALSEANAHGALSVQELHKAVLEMSLSREKPYWAHPSETFVHECMSEAAGIEPYTVEAFSMSHSLEYTYVSYLGALANDHGFKPTLIRGAMKRFMGLFTQPERLRSRLAGMHTAPLWEGL